MTACVCVDPTLLEEAFWTSFHLEMLWQMLIYAVVARRSRVYFNSDKPKINKDHGTEEKLCDY